MSDVLIIDNFANLESESNTGTLQQPWAYTRYQRIGRPMVRVQQVEGRLCLYSEAKSVVNSPSWAFSRLIGAVQSDIVIGFRLLGVSATAFSGTASFALGEVLNDDVFAAVLTLEFTTNAVQLSYKDYNNEVQVQTIPTTLGLDCYVDMMFSRVALGEPGTMSSFTLFIDNTPVFRGNVFNNAASSLSVALMCTAVPSSVMPDGIVAVADPETTAPPNLGYGVTDFFISRNGKRFGKPVVTNIVANSVATDMVTTGTSTPLEIVNQLPNNWDYLQGSQLSASYDVPTGGGVAQFSALFQGNSVAEAASIRVSSGSVDRSLPLSENPQMVSVITSNNSSAIVEFSS